MPNTNDMYQCIEAERARNGMTLKEFADKIGIGEKTYRNWRDSKKPISSEILIKISVLFGVSIDYLLGLTDKIKIS